jgi:hypothetical protein
MAMATKFVRVKSKGGPDLEFNVTEAAFNAFPDRYVAVGGSKPHREESKKTSGIQKKEES